MKKATLLLMALFAPLGFLHDLRFKQIFIKEKKMKKFALSFILLLIATIGFSQNVPITFEVGEHGTDWTWTTFENGDPSPALEIAANPSIDTNNPSATAAKFVAAAGDGSSGMYAGCASAHPVDNGGIPSFIGEFTLTDQNCIIKMMVYKSTIGPVGVKLVSSTNWGEAPRMATNTKINEWEELSFNFSNSLAPGVGIYDQIAIHVDMIDRTVESIIYFDDIRFTEKTEDDATEPTTGAPTPPARDAADVLSIFSDAYTDVAGTNFNPNWGQATTQTFEVIDGNNTLKYADFNYQGTNFGSDEGSNQDVSAMDYLHIDMWTANATVVDVYTVSRSTGDPHYVTLPITKAQWVSYDIPKADFTSQGASWTDIFQFKFDGTGGNSPSTIYLDNLYFYKKMLDTTDATLSTLLYGSTSVPNFNPNILTYDVELIYGTTTAPALSATTSMDNATAVINDIGAALPGTSTVVVTAEDGTTELTYSVNFTVSTTISSDASLKELFFNGIGVSDFSSTTFHYAVTLPEGTTEVPEVTATRNNLGASIVYDNAATLSDTTSVIVTAQDGTTTLTYKLSFSVITTNTLPIDFEDGPYGFTDFDGGIATVITNPHSSGINTSATVAQIVRDGGATWAGSKLLLDSKIDFSTYNTFSMKVYSTRANIPVQFKLEGSGQNTFLSVNTTVANEWETLTWDFTGAATNIFEELVFMFDIGTVGNGSANSTFLFDDVVLYDRYEGKERMTLPLDFDDPDVFYELTDFNGHETVIGEDPTDVTNTVAITTKPVGTGGAAGTTIGAVRGYFSNSIPFTVSETVMSVMVYSPAAGIPVLLKVEENGDPTHNCETYAYTTKVNTWEKLIFDFSNESQIPGPTQKLNLSYNFDMVSIFFNKENNGTGNVYYWDDVMFGEGASAISFEEINNIRIYSNNGILHLNGSDELINGRVEAFDLTGRQVVNSTITNINEQFILSSKGVLIVRITNASNEYVLTQKLIVR